MDRITWLEAPIGTAPDRHKLTPYIEPCLKAPAAALTEGYFYRLLANLVFTDLLHHQRH